MFELPCVLRPFTFSNVVTTPAGTLLALPHHSVRTDEEIYPNVHEIENFQFSGFVIRRGMMSWRLDTSRLLHHLNYWALGLGDTRGKSLQPPSSQCLFP